MISSNIKDVFERISNSLTDTLGQPITLYFKSASMDAAASNPVAPYGLNSFDYNGFPQDTSDITGVSQQGQNLKETFVTEILNARVYWIEDMAAKAKVLGTTNILSNQKVLRLVIKKGDLPRFLQCHHIVVSAADNTLVQMSAIIGKEPILYGLGKNVNAIMYWVSA